MGYYINPVGQTKEQWLTQHGQRAVPEHPAPEGNHFVCLVDNGWMTAAGIAYDDGERKTFMRPDGRPKKWYVVPDNLLEEVCPDVKGQLKEY